MEVKINLRKKTSLAHIHNILTKFNTWFSEFDPKVEVTGCFMIITFDLKEKKDG